MRMVRRKPRKTHCRKQNNIMSKDGDNNDDDNNDAKNEGSNQ